MRQVPAVRERHPEERVARLEAREVDGGVRLRAGVGLDVRVDRVGVLRREELLRPRDGERLGDVDVLAAAVVAAARVPFGVLVRQDRAHRLEDGAGGVVLGGDQLEAVALAGELGVDGGGDLGVDRGEGAPHQAGARGEGRAHRGVSFVARRGGVELVDAPLVAPAGERCAQEGLEDRHRERDGGDARAEGEDVRVVVLAHQLRGEEVGRHSRPRAGHAVGGDRDADSASADDDAALRPPGGDGPADGEAVVGVVDGDGGGGAEVEHLVAELGRAAGEELFQLEARVVGAERDAHR